MVSIYQEIPYVKSDLQMALDYKINGLPRNDCWYFGVVVVTTPFAAAAYA